MPEVEPFEKYSSEYEEWFLRNREIYLSELKAIKYFIPENKNGIEIGIGSGKFAEPLGIKTGIDPSKEMRRLAGERGLTVYDGVAEKIPLADASFDFALMVTSICFLDDEKKAFDEIYRILKENGSIIVGFIDRDSPLGQKYLEHKEQSVFYKNAKFHSTEEVISLLKGKNFSSLEIIQTVFGGLSEIDCVQEFKEGYGTGGFVVIRGEKEGA